MMWWDEMCGGEMMGGGGRGRAGSAIRSGVLGRDSGKGRHGTSVVRGGSREFADAMKPQLNGVLYCSVKPHGVFSTAMKTHSRSTCEGEMAGGGGRHSTWRPYWARWRSKRTR
ncbi:MAG TPA: hypothetical protein VL485_01065 [Ktedonobacteraceae bacterium]|nr:hypothetical protein [Ktedonobacteraceae bacterium]